MVGDRGGGIKGKGSGLIAISKVLCYLMGVGTVESMVCNINQADRINRSVIGVILLVAALLGMGKTFFMVLGFIFVLQGMVGWCSIPYLIKKLKIKP